MRLICSGRRHPAASDTSIIVEGHENLRVSTGGVKRLAGLLDRCTTTDAKTEGSNRAPVSDCLQTLVLNGLESGNCGGSQPAEFGVLPVGGVSVLVLGHDNIASRLGIDRRRCSAFMSDYAR